MKHIYLLTAAFLVMNAAAFGQVQIENGSFESDDNPSLSGWEWTCEDPALVNDAPFGGGVWCAAKDPSHAKGCFPNYLYQRLNGVENGELITLSVWLRCSLIPSCVGAFIGLGTVNNGAFQLEETEGTQSSNWTFVSITDTMDLSVGDTALVVLNSGFTGGPANFAKGHFDSVNASITLGIPLAEREAPVQYMDRSTGLLHVDFRSAFNGDAMVFDLTGQQVTVQSTRTSPTALSLDLNGLTPGVYFLLANTDQGRRTVRFSTW